MKTTKSIGLFLLCIFCCINFTSCDPANNGGDDLIWDFAPIVLYISVQDAQGNDLLNPLTKGSIANQGIKAIYKGETYEKDAPLNERTRAYMAYFTGLQTEVSKDGKYYLTFGEFNGDHTLLNSDGFPITKKEFAIEEAEAHGMYGITTEIAKTCRLIPPDDQIYNHIKLKLGIDGEKSSNTFNIFIGRPYNFWIYEDLTEYYKDKYPDGKVKEIVRLLKSKPNNPTKQ